MATHDEATLYFPHRTSDSTYRIPTPPRIVVPPPQLNNNALPEITFNPYKSGTFLNNISYNNIITQNALLEWTYERRREAQLILPYLFMGPMTAAKNENFLRSQGITCLLGVRQKGAFEGKLMAGALRKAQDMGLETHAFDIGSLQDLISAFPATSELIYKHVAAKHMQTGEVGKVYVFCESGNDRSAGVVAAYLMEAHADVDYIKAMQLVQAQRFCVNFDDSMKRLLQSYWDIVCAKRSVSTGAGGLGTAVTNGDGDAMTDAVATPAPAKAKRSLERDDDEMMEGVDEDDKERFGGRSSAPFSEQPL